MALKCAVDNWKRTYTLQKFFRTAVCQNDVTTVKGLITHQRDGIDLDAWNNDGICPIHQCCIDGNKKLLSVLLKGGANINAADPKGWTSLHTSAAIGNYDLTKYLIRNGADIMLETMNGEIPIDLSFNVSIALLLGTEMKAQGYAAEAEYYLNKIESYQKTQSLKRESRLTLAQEQYIEEHDLVVSNSSGSDSLKVNQHSRRRSSQRKNKRSSSVPENLVTHFLTKKRNSLPNYPLREIDVYPTSILKKYDSYDSSSYSSASSSGQNSPTPPYSRSSSSSSSSDECESDDSSGSKPTLKRQHSVQFDTETLFMNYVQENEYMKLSKLLEDIQDLSIINTLDRKGLSAVHWATIKGYPECIEVLHNFGAEIDITDPFGWTPLHAAVATNNVRCVEQLLELNADLYALTKDGESVFDWTPGQDILDILKSHIQGRIDAGEVRCTSI